MTVRINKPALNLREKLTELDKPSGIAGEAMLRAETPQEQFNLIGAGRKNLIINGGFDVWQRGTSFTDTVNLTRYTADRFVMLNGGANGTLSRHTLVPANKGFKYSAQYSGTSSDPVFQQYIEGSQAVAGRAATFSFWINGTLSDLAFTAGYIYDGAYTSFSTLDVSLIEKVGTWNRYSVTHTFATGDYNPIVRLDFAENVATTIQTTGWQLELGKVATPFEHRSYGEELALCQRYYYRIDSAYNNANFQRFAVASIESGTEAEGFFTHPVEMRAIPTLGFSAASDFHVYTASVVRAVSGLLLDQSSPTTAGVAITSTGMTAGNVGLLNANNNKNAFIEFKAEL